MYNRIYDVDKIVKRDIKNDIDRDIKKEQDKKYGANLQQRNFFDSPNDTN